MRKTEPNSVNERYRAYLDQAFPRRDYRRRFAIVLLIFVLLLYCIVQAAVQPHYPLVLLSVLGLAVFLRASFSLQRSLKARRQVSRLYRIAKNGVPVTAYLIQANSELFKAGNETLPGFVLFSFQPEVDGDAEYMRFLARRVARLKGTRPIDVDGRLVAGMVSNERSVMDRRRRLPISFTDGSTVYCADLWIRRSYLPQPILNVDTLPCLAEPGDGGGIELLPAGLHIEPSETTSSSSHKK